MQMLQGFGSVALALCLSFGRTGQRPGFSVLRDRSASAVLTLPQLRCGQLRTATAALLTPWGGCGVSPGCFPAAAVAITPVAWEVWMVELSVVGAPMGLPGPGSSGVDQALKPAEGSGPGAALVPASEGLCCSRVVVAGGGRELAWPPARVAAALLGASAGRPVHLLLHGDARGADQSIDRAARRLGWAVQAVPADWQRLGRAAGPIRNRQLLRRALLAAQLHSQPGYPASVLVVAFPGGRGTASLVQLARELQKSQEQAALVERAPAVAVVEITSTDGAFSPIPQR